MKLLFILAAFVVAIVMGRIIIPYIMLVTFRKRLFDPVSNRKVHKGIVPRLGGVAFAPVQCTILTLSVVIMYKFNISEIDTHTSAVLPMFLVLMAGIVLLFMMGVMDDLVGVSYKWKFVVQIITASFFPLAGLWINDLYGILFITYLPDWVGIPLTIFITVLIINAINLIDGIDGLCSGLMIVASITLGTLFLIKGAWLHATFAFITAGVLLPFFYYNVFGRTKRHRRIFMGDTGSLTLGYSIAFLAISYTMNNPYIETFSEGAIVVAFSAVLIPVLDVGRVMLLRFRQGRPVFQPDRNHIHHKFLRLGISHRYTMILILAMALFFSVFNIVSVEIMSNNIVLLLDLLIWIGFHLWLGWIEKRKLKPQAEKAALAQKEDTPPPEKKRSLCVGKVIELK
ncbi:MAG: undecaprenyl/decaprenyl-phosphate alpha-N-acetylglucosaminyl 1-phosphate transferase [Dysgonamonadaceae bacterium]|jgi:UDP-N-acetylmuramyl pentapeptide phosphotransferase/UDP-N-acetylglucosamine-1-phosphate transferase|nr:undecaprenyl/decaprenyl-phosphate alpha-N-acetylglucosaminyl 1-phosphate transferase [Dysgonamonadaceae bacterium]